MQPMATMTKEKAAEYNRRWRETHPETVAEQRRRYQEAHAERIREYKREWRRKNKAEIAEYRRQWKEQNAEKVAESKRKWQQNNREKVNEAERRRQANRREQRRRDLERQRAMQLIAERRQTAMWLEAMGMPAQRINPTPATAAAVNQLAADEFFARVWSREEARALRITSDQYRNSDASKRRSQELREAARAAARAKRAAYKSPAQIAREAEEARMDAIAREINARLRLKK